MDPIIHLRFDEVSDDPADAGDARPRDAAGNLDDLEETSTLILPAVTQGILGWAKTFAGERLSARDINPGSTLATRDCSIRFVCRFDPGAIGPAATIIFRGNATSTAEYGCFGIEVCAVNVALGVCKVRWLWHDAAGTLKRQIGSHFGTDVNRWIMVTATRRWISTTSVRLRYYVADQLIGEILSADGSIGGGTTAETSIGMRLAGASPTAPFAGDLDELQVYNRELAPEEIAATWDRIMVQQPRGEALLLEMHDPGFPMPNDPSSLVRRETSLWGQGIGYASAQVENIRNNIMPDRAYGEILERWEALSGATPKPSDSIETRRARVMALLRSRLGASIDGIGLQIQNLIGTALSNLQWIAFSQTITDDFPTVIADEMWEQRHGGYVAALPGARTTPVAGTYKFDASSAFDWKNLEMPVGGDGQGAFIFGRIDPTTLPANGEVGMYIGNYATLDYLLIGLRNVAGTYTLETEQFLAGISQGLVAHGTIALPASIWFRISQPVSPISMHDAPPANRNVTLSWSTTSDSAGFTSFTPISHPSRFQLAGFYFRTNGATGSGSSALMRDFYCRAPAGLRPFFFYAYRNPALPGMSNYDQTGLLGSIDVIKQAFTEGDVVTSLSTLCDNDSCGCDFTPLGGI